MKSVPDAVKMDDCMLTCNLKEFWTRDRSHCVKNEHRSSFQAVTIEFVNEITGNYCWTLATKFIIICEARLNGVSITGGIAAISIQYIYFKILTKQKKEVNERKN
jgi:hypothetical protein